MKLFWIMLAGALGAATRYGLSLAIQNGVTNRGGEFPLATLLINVSGAFCLSFLVVLALQGRVSEETRLALGTGFLGAYTTFSTFAVESDALFNEKKWGAAALYVGGNLALGWAAVWLGRAAAWRLVK